MNARCCGRSSDGWRPTCVCNLVERCAVPAADRGVRLWAALYKWAGWPLFSVPYVTLVPRVQRTMPDGSTWMNNHYTLYSSGPENASAQ